MDTRQGFHKRRRVFVIIWILYDDINALIFKNNSREVNDTALKTVGLGSLSGECLKVLMPEC
jgi:hypothetical protein